MEQVKLADLKAKSPTELIQFAEEQDVENASTLRKQELMFAILKNLADNEVEIIGEGTVEVLSDGFAYLRNPSANYLPGPDDIYISPSQLRKFALRTGDTVTGPIRSPRTASAISRCCRSTRSTTTTRKRSGTRSISTTSRRSTRRSATRSSSTTRR